MKWRVVWFSVELSWAGTVWDHSLEMKSLFSDMNHLKCSVRLERDDSPAAQSQWTKGQRASWTTGDSESQNQFHTFIHSVKPRVCMFIFIQLSHWVHEAEMSRQQCFGDIGDDHSFAANISDYTQNSKSGWVRSISCSQDTICCCMITLKWVQRTTQPVITTPQQLLVSWYEQQKTIKQIALKERNVLHLK